MCLESKSDHYVCISSLTTEMPLNLEGILIINKLVHMCWFVLEGFSIYNHYKQLYETIERTNIFIIIFYQTYMFVCVCVCMWYDVRVCVQYSKCMCTVCMYTVYCIWFWNEQWFMAWCNYILTTYVLPQILSLSKKCVNKAVLNKLKEF